MAYFSGVNGSMRINGTKAGRVSQWSISSNIGMLEGTTLGDTDRIPVPGVRSMTGSCVLFYYQSTPGSNAGNDASELVRKLIKGRTTGSEPGKAAETDKVTFDLQVDDGSAAGKHLKVDAYLTSAQMQMGVGEVFAAQVSFEVIGAPLEVAL